MSTPKEELLGLKLPKDWKVIERLNKKPGDTGGNFSASYVVQSREGKKYFLKAIDFASALNQPDPARALQILTEAFNLERDILQISKTMSCVVTIVDDGSFQLDHSDANSTVQYLILELANRDLRRMATESGRLPMRIALRALHQAANGLRQLHQENIAHQDLKPSNVLGFEGNEFKICDVGRATIKGRVAPHDGFRIAGDRAYAPPELLYGHVDAEFNIRRKGADLFMLGSLGAFLITGVPMTTLILGELDSTAHPENWNGTYKQVMPQVLQSFSKAIDLVRKALPGDAPYSEELVRCIKELCEPDPAYRGHPYTRAIMAGSGNIFDLERYVSIFDRLVAAATIYDSRKLEK